MNTTERCPECGEWKYTGRPCAVCADNSEMKPDASFSLTITGQVRGGKNNMVVTRSGHHFPRASWAKWRDAAVREVRAQLPKSWRAIAEPVSVTLTYVAGDRRRRDFPAIVDAVWHVLEKAEIVTDDNLLWVGSSSRSYDKAAPKITISFP